MTVKTLKKHYKKNFPEGHFFDKETLEYWGESINTMSISKNLVDFEGHKCYELVALQKSDYHNLNRYVWFYFDCETFAYIDCKLKKD